MSCFQDFSYCKNTLNKHSPLKFSGVPPPLGAVIQNTRPSWTLEAQPALAKISGYVAANAIVANGSPLVIGCTNGIITINDLGASLFGPPLAPCPILPDSLVKIKNRQGTRESGAQ
jgi:hypothetical protein